MDRRDFVGAAATASVLIPFSALTMGFGGARRTSKGLFNVSTFGAVGDGSHNDTDSIQKALRAAAGGVLEFPPGRYLVSRALVVPPNTTVLGAGIGLSIIVAAQRGDWAAPKPSSWVFILGAVNTVGVEIRGLTVDANGEVASGIAVLGGDHPRIFGCEVVNAQVHSGVHLFGRQTPAVQPTTNGEIIGNVVRGCTYNIVCDGQNENVTIAYNNSIDPGVTHVSLDGSQGGDGNSNITVIGNVTQGMKGGAQNTFLCYVGNGVVLSSNSAYNSVRGRGGRQGQHVNVQESQNVVISSNSFVTTLSDEYPAWGFLLGASQVAGQGNVVDGVNTGFYLIGTSNPPTPFRDTVLLNARRFMTTNDPSAVYEATYDLGGSFMNGARYLPKFTQPGGSTKSGTVYRNTYGFPITLYQPVYAETGKIGSVRVSAGADSPPPVLFVQRVSSEARESAPDISVVRVPASGYYQFETTSAKLGVPTVVGE